MKYTKPHLTFEEQLDLLVSRGLVVPDRASAVRELRRINYYRLSAYGLPFQRTKDRFNDGTTIDQLLRLYEFDHDLRVIVFDTLEFVEIALRTALTYHMGEAYGPFGYTNPSNFSPGFYHTDWLNDIEVQISRSRETFITHYKTKYKRSPHFPIWMITEVISFGALSRMYRGLRFKDQKVISSKFSVPAPVFQSWLHSLVYLRNLCAHHTRLWNRELAIPPKIPQKDKLWHVPFTIRNNRVFSMLSILRYCSNRLESKRMLKRNLMNLLRKYPEVPLVPMGMQDGWEIHAIWK